MTGDPFIVKFKRTETAGAVPERGRPAKREVIVNLTDHIAWFGGDHGEIAEIYLNDLPLAVRSFFEEGALIYQEALGKAIG